MTKDLKQTQWSCFRALRDISGFVIQTLILENALQCHVQYFVRENSFQTEEFDRFQIVVPRCEVICYVANGHANIVLRKKIDFSLYGNGWILTLQGK